MSNSSGWLFPPAGAFPFITVDSLEVRVLEVNVRGSLDGLSGTVQGVPVVLPAEALEKEPGEYPLEEKATRFTRLLHRALAEGVVSLSKASVLGRIPIEKLQQEMVSGG